MNIGAAAEASGLPAKTIRYYEEIGLVSPDRRENSYRDYSEQHVHKLRFLQRARSLGFSVEECRRLLSLYEDESRASADVKRLAQSHLDDINTKIVELQSMGKVLENLVHSCRGDERADCPILNDLAQDKGVAS
ncbi:MAG: Cu(I)-responsive transcriptional regulator [Hyphomicrobiales bacterium]